MQKVIELKSVSKRLGNFELGPLNFSIPQGYIVGYIGENGAGKSSTSKLLLGLMQADQGEIRIFGEAVEDLTPERKKDIAYVFDNLYLPEEMNLRSIVHFHQLFYGKAWQNETFTKLNKRFNLPENQAIKHFSRGMKMQLGLALALSHGAKLLLLDEATSGLDPVIRDDVLDLLLEYIQDESHTILVSSHILSDLEKVADYIAFIHEGQLLFLEAKDELINQYGLASLSKEQLTELDPEAIKGKRAHQFGVEVLVQHDLVPPQVPLEKVSIEEIMVYMLKEDRS